MSKILNPGSKEAQDEGCTCPVLDNNYGKGINGSFWMNGDCPLHGTAPTHKSKDVEE